MSKGLRISPDTWDDGKDFGVSHVNRYDSVTDAAGPGDRRHTDRVRGRQADPCGEC
jgi:hypothetical protein